MVGVSVAVKQIMPDHILARTPIGKITNRNIPLAVFGLTFIMWAIGGCLLCPIVLHYDSMYLCRYGRGVLLYNVWEWAGHIMDLP